LKGSDFTAGLHHGIVYGDGTLSNEGKQAHIIFYKTGKKQELAKLFGAPYTVTPHHAGEYVGVYGLPVHYKTSLPTNENSAEYWYGFLCGILATDGHITPEGGEVTLSQKKPEMLHALRSGCSGASFAAN
jgi:ribonucleoside-diphosphate reductase alpha chain